MTFWLVLISTASIAQAASVLAAQAVGGEGPQAFEDPEAVRIDDVFVMGRRGSTQFTPETELGEDEIDALGAYDIGEVTYRIGRKLGFTEPPIIVVNGRRALNSADFSRFPPDALVRVEALPPEAGAIYGDDPSRRVLNIVLQPEYRSRDGLVRGARPTKGGSSSLAVEVSQSEIHGDATRQFGAQIVRDTALRADERGVYSRDHPGTAGLTLRPSAESVAFNVSATGAIGEWSSSLNTAAQIQSGHFVSGAGGQILRTRQETRTLTAAGALGGQAMGWSVRLGLDGNLSDARQDGVTESRSRGLYANANFGADRTLTDLPAGSLRANLSSRFSYAQAVSDVGLVQTRLSTQDLDLNGHFVIPLSRRRPLRENGAGMAWGDISATLGGRVRGLVGSSTRGEGMNAGLNWSPVRQLRFNAQWSMSTDGPADQQRLAPASYGPPVVVFDFITGDSVEILPIVGGNPDLRPPTSHRFSASISAGPYTSWQMSGSLNFARARSIDGISSLPALTPELEAAFPDRFTRGADGRLVSIDQRPINLDSDSSESLSSSLNFNVPFSRTPSADAAYLQLGVNHSWQLKNRLTINQGLPGMDRLAGDGGGVSRHQASLSADGRYRKWGFNAAANWRSASHIRRDSGRDGPDDLKLDDFATVDLRLSYAFEPNASADQSAPRSRRYDGVRLELAITNLFDTRPHATLGDGRPAPGYGRDDQDPVGRVAQLTLSRRF